MTNLNVYLTFSGNCREAMTFYKECIGGELSFQTIGESPLSDKMPEQMKNCILHSTLSGDNLILMASDMVGEGGLKRGNAVSLMLNCRSEKDIREFYEKLSQGGKRTHELEHAFFGALFGDLVDKFGNQWLLHYQKK